MPITKTITLYKIDEIKDDKLYAKVIENYRDINIDTDVWHEFIIEDETAKLKECGYNDGKISISGFYSQGDGASFTAKSIDLAKWIKANGYKATEEVIKAIEDGTLSGAVVRNDNHYSHENTVSVEIGSENGDAYDVLGTQRLEQAMTDDVRTRSRAIYKNLENVYEDLTTEDSVYDTLAVNEYYFNEDGRIDNP